jgi:hypothetical protein
VQAVLSGSIAQHSCEESPDTFIPRSKQNVLGSPHFPNLTVNHDRDAVGYLLCKTNLVGHDDHRRSGICEFSHDIEHLPDQLGIQR